MKRLLYLVLCTAVLGGIFLAGRSSYRHWRQQRLLRDAEAFVAGSDATNAVLCLQRALQLEPRNPSACRMFASLAEKAGSRNAIAWRRRVVELEPLKWENRIAWGNTALVLGDFDSAQEAFLSIAHQNRNTKEYHKGLGVLAWAQDNFSEAESEFEKALELEPGNEATRLKLAAARLATGNETKAALGRATLETLRTNSSVKLDACRILMEAAVKEHCLDKAIIYADELQKRAGRFEDRLLYVDLLRMAHRAEGIAHLHALQDEAGTNSTKAAVLANWLTGNGAPAEALAWAQTLPATMRTNPPLSLSIAESEVALENWPNLDASLTSQHWNEYEYLRHLLKAKALREQGKTQAGAVEWRSALKAASRTAESLRDVAHRAAGWNWEQELTEALWNMVTEFPRDTDAFASLYAQLEHEGNTSALHKLLTRASGFAPLTTGLSNNLAIVSLLLYPQQPQGHSLAHQLYKALPANAHLASTYAYSLYLQGKIPEARAAMESLSAESLAKPAIALYYGLLLADDGDVSRARHYLELAARSKLLPQEQAILKRATERL